MLVAIGIVLRKFLWSPKRWDEADGTHFGQSELSNFFFLKGECIQNSFTSGAPSRVGAVGRATSCTADIYPNAEVFVLYTAT